MQVFDLSGRVALVTGGNGGIGLGMAKGLASAGARVAIAGRSADKLKAARAALGPETIALEGDLSDAETPRRLIDAVLEQAGRLDILINNAGLNLRRAPEDIAAAEWDALFAVNARAALLCAQAAYPAMRRQGGGKIVNVASIAVQFGSQRVAAYAASKAALLALTRSLAQGWAADNIQVNAILPGWVDTEMTRAARADRPGLAERVLARVPAHRWGTPEDFAGVAVFLASRASDFMTGGSLTLDGGYSIDG